MKAPLGLFSRCLVFKAELNNVHVILYTLAGMIHSQKIEVDTDSWTLTFLYILPSYYLKGCIMLDIFLNKY